MQSYTSTLDHVYIKGMNESVLTSLLHTIPSSLSTKVFLVLLLIFGLKSLKSQEIDKNYELGDKIIHSKEAAVADSLFNEIIVQIILDEINMILEHRGFDIKTENPLLKKAAVDQASYMALTETDLLTRKEKGKQNTGERIAFYGGSKNGVELSSKTAIGKGNTYFSYAKIADEMVFRWFANSKKAELIEKNHFNLVGVGAMLDKEKRKVYVSLVLGNYKSLNQGADLINELSVPYPTKNYGLEPPTAANCKNINRLQHLSNLHSNLKVEGNTIYFETDDIRPLNKLLREKKDGLAVDILLNEQFQCNGPNRID